MQKYYSIMTNKGREYINEQVLVNTKTILADGWYIKLGNGTTPPTANMTDLSNVIFDKNNDNYPQITFGKNADGHYAEMLLPESLKGQIITEAGLYNSENTLIAVAKTYIDLSKNGDGLELSVKQRVYLSAVPTSVNVIYTAQADLITEKFLNETLLNKANVSLNNLDAQGQAILNNKSSVSLNNLDATGEAHFANPNLSNLSANGIDFINQSKAMYTGQVSNNPIVYADVEKAYHSTFDLSKFAVWGNPTITSDGIASGFNFSNRIDTIKLDVTKKNYCIKLGNFEYKGGQTFVFGTPFNTNYYSFDLIINANKLGLYLSPNGTNWGVASLSTGSSTLTAGTIYDISFIRENGNKYKVVVFNHSTNIETTEIVIESELDLFNSNKKILLGSVGGAWVDYTGSIDLKQFSITAAGVEVFSGNKTGLDVIKPDNYTVVGSPVISDDGVASGFSQTNYLTFITNYSPKTFTKIIKFTPKSSDLSSVKIIYANAVSYTSYLQIFLNAGKLGCTIRYNNTDIANTASGTIDVQADKTYWAKIEYLNGNYSFNYSTDGRNYTNIWTIVSENVVFETNNKIGDDNLTPNRAFDGSIDLNEFKVYVDGNLVYQPCLKVPYTLTHGGAKITDMQYLGRVQDAYKQGYTYYQYLTINEENQQFTLPQGMSVYEGIANNTSLNEIGIPIPTLSNALKDNEIWLEGAEVNKITYFKLYEIYGDNYGTPTGSNNFILPDFRGRVLQGMETGGNWGYISAGLPNITGKIDSSTTSSDAEVFGETPKSSTLEEGALSGIWGSQIAVPDALVSANNILKGFSFNAASSNSIYGNSTTVQPPAIKVRFKTKYE